VALIDRLETDADRVQRAWVLAEVTRSRGLIAAARGAIAEGDSDAGARRRGTRRGGRPFRARAGACLPLAIVRRRARQEAPCARRDRVGAPGVRGARRSDLGRPGRGRSSAGSAGGTARSGPDRGRAPGCRAPSRPVGQNREVAAELFLGERTVASHLTHVYAKLGVRSRTELARRLP